MRTRNELYYLFIIIIIIIIIIIYKYSKWNLLAW